MESRCPVTRSLKALGENALLRSLLSQLPSGPDVRTGPGDDCAVVAPPGSREDWLLTTDAVVEGRHFPRRSACAAAGVKPPWIGRKALARAFSDVAAMGGMPRYVLVNLVASADTPVDFILGMYRGMGALAAREHAGILGGDTTEGERLELHVTVIGAIPRGRAILRSGAGVGDVIYVTGHLGGAWGNGARKQYLFTPRLTEGRFLSAGRWASAMMDLSDGLSIDLPRLLDASRKGVELDLARIPVASVLRGDSQAISRACGDGEDFELLFCVPARKRAAFEAAWKAQRPRLASLHAIGHVLADPRVQNIPAGGWEHFHGKRAPRR